MTKKYNKCVPCEGTGLADEHNVCSACNGSGRVKKTKEVTEAVPTTDTNPPATNEVCQGVVSVFNEVPEGGNPTGGFTDMANTRINWQDGILVDGLKNGAFVEDVITAAIQRLEYFQNSKFNCQENADAITSLQDALSALETRTKARVEQGVENTYETHK